MAKSKKDEKAILVRFNDNWADEFDCDGFTIMSEKEWKNYKKLANKVIWPREIGFGTNEHFEYDSAQDYLSAFIRRRITKSEEALIRKIFHIKTRLGSSSFGIIPLLDAVDLEGEVT